MTHTKIAEIVSGSISKDVSFAAHGYLNGGSVSNLIPLLSCVLFRFSYQYAFDSLLSTTSHQVLRACRPLPQQKAASRRHGDTVVVLTSPNTAAVNPDLTNTHKVYSTSRPSTMV